MHPTLVSITWWQRASSERASVSFRSSVVMAAVVTSRAGSGSSRSQRRTRKRKEKVFPRQKVDVEEPKDGMMEEHRIFDEVNIRVRSGNGGDGEMAQSSRGRTVKNYKYHAGKNQPKNIFLPAGKPCSGGDGGDVIIRVDPALYGLTHLHKREVYCAKNGRNGDAGGSMVRKLEVQPKQDPLVLSVPPGTSVHLKKTGQLLAELLHPKQSCNVAIGGRGGAGVTIPPKKKKQEKKKVEEDDMIFDVEDHHWKLDAKGMPGQELSLLLLLRVVADVGIVGLPNAGKSSLLRAMTNAKPRIARYPFTTLMPNLGVLEVEQDDFNQVNAPAPVIADLPGLIEGAHLGKGLGRNFLRHLKRTNMMIHVLDATSYNIFDDFKVIREELRMYNPEYIKRPFIVVLNKMDMPRAEKNRENAHAMLQQCFDEFKLAEIDTALPSAVLETSAREGTGIEELLLAINRAMETLNS